MGVVVSVAFLPFAANVAGRATGAAGRWAGVALRRRHFPEEAMCGVQLHQTLASLADPLVFIFIFKGEAAREWGGAGRGEGQHRTSHITSRQTVTL